LGKQETKRLCVQLRIAGRDCSCFSSKPKPGSGGREVKNAGWLTPISASKVYGSSSALDDACYNRWESEGNLYMSRSNCFVWRSVFRRSELSLRCDRHPTPVKEGTHSSAQSNPTFKTYFRSVRLSPHTDDQLPIRIPDRPRCAIYTPSPPAPAPSSASPDLATPTAPSATAAVPRASFGAGGIRRGTRCMRACVTSSARVCDGESLAWRGVMTSLRCSLQAGKM